MPTPKKCGMSTRGQQTAPCIRMTEGTKDHIEKSCLLKNHLTPYSSDNLRLTGDCDNAQPAQ